MAKLTLSSIPSGYATATAHNADNTAIEAAIENTLSRDGTSPNQMNANLDMNGYAILNQRATSGNENFIWMGTWTTGTSYAVNNLVYAPEGSNLGNTLICVTANTAGATLDGDAANWAVFAQRGASGAGTGDVVGPASSTADSLARFSGTTGKLLKNGAVIGTDVQAYSAKLASFATNTLSAASKIPYATALNTAGELDFLDEDTMASNSATAVPSQQSVKAYVDAASSITLGTSQNATGTSVTFTGIPATAKRITVIFSGVSTNGTSPTLIQLGGSGGIEVTGYNSSAFRTNGIAIANTGSTAGFITGYDISNSDVRNGTYTLVNISGNIWIGNGLFGYSAGQTTGGAGSKTLSSTLTQLTITTISSTDTFDTGTINILYE